MCQAIRDYGKENLNKGKSIGRTEGINIGRNLKVLTLGEMKASSKL